MATPYAGQWFGDYNGNWLGQQQAGTCYYGDWNGITCGDWYGPTGGVTPPVPPAPTPGAIGGSRLRRKRRQGPAGVYYPEGVEVRIRESRERQQGLDAGPDRTGSVIDRVKVLAIEPVPVAAESVTSVTSDLLTVLPVDTSASLEAEAAAKRKQKQRNNALALLLILAAK